VKEITFTDVGDIVKTKIEADEFIGQLDELDSLFYQSAVGIEALFSQSLSYTKKEALLTLFRSHEISLIDRAQVKTALSQIKYLIESMPVVPMILAIDPKEPTVEAIVLWFRLQLQLPVLLDLSIDRSLIGGAVILYKGFYKDYSVHKNLLDHEKTIQELLIHHA
jgi:F0F1-type ATP synthase delta subunit